MGHNSEPTDDERASIHFRHVQDYDKVLTAKKFADAEFKNRCKIIKSEGGSLKAIKLTIALRTPEGVEAFKADIAEQTEIASWNGVGIQVDLFDEAMQPSGDKARAEGKRHGLSGEPRQNPHHHTVPQHSDYEQGYLAGQAVLAKGFKPTLVMTESPPEKIFPGPENPESDSLDHTGLGAEETI